jgi:hypothetical protein
MHVMDLREDNKVNNIMMVETGTEPEEIEIGEERLHLQAINEHVPEGLQLQEVLEDQHQGDLCGPQAGDRDDGYEQDGGGRGEGASGRHNHGERDDQVLVKTSIKLQLVRRRYRLKVGKKRDGLLQPTVNNFFSNNSGRGATDG